MNAIYTRPARAEADGCCVPDSTARGATLASAQRLHALAECRAVVQDGGCMSLHIVRLGQPRQPQEGLRLGTVRRPPRGVAKRDHAAQDWYDVWYPNLAPSAAALAQARAAKTDADWAAFLRRYRAEMAAPEARHSIALLAALSHRTQLAVGCYCADERRCHRSVLRALLAAAGAAMA